MPRDSYRHDGAAGSAWVAAVGQRLRWLREVVADNQSQAARLIGVDQSTFSGYEAGDRLLSIQAAMRACAIWGVTLDYLYRGLLDSRVRHDVAVRLAAAHPELVEAPEPPPWVPRADG
jgi:transcriptional regulator with XRE-family HTH domain